jgi:hypothetical protein
LTTTVFSLEPAGSREVLKEWIYPDYQRPAGGRPPAEVIDYIEKNGYGACGIELLEREYDFDGYRVRADGTRVNERRDDL